MTKLTEFEQATANQMAGCDNPSDRFIEEAQRMVKKWNDERARLNLELW